ncbi:hypothetical protein GCM10022221_64690 [Actinocorallia aurea]
MDKVDFRTLFDVAPVALALMSPEFDYVSVNRAHERLFRLPREECVGRNVFEVFPGRAWPQGAESLRAALERALAGEEGDVLTLQRYDIEVPGGSGESTERYWIVAATAFPEPDGTIGGVVVRVQEVTSSVDGIGAGGLSAFSGAGATHAAAVEARLFAQAGELQEINRSLRSAGDQERRISEGLREIVRRQREAVADTSHDLRGPVTGLQLRLEDALADPDADPRAILRSALRDAERLGDIIGDLLQLARLEEGAAVPTEPVDLARLVRDELARSDPGTATTTHLDFGVVVNASPIRLARLVGNLLANAERHARSRVEARVTAQGDTAVLEVIDDGPGIPDADKEQVFTRFYRRPDARTADPGGSGLGLAISREIAESHGGTLHVTDRPDGSPGARLVLRLPLPRP